MKAAFLAAAVLVAMCMPANAGRISGPADVAAGLTMRMDGGSSVAVSCPEPSEDVDAYLFGATITNAEGPKAGRINSLSVGAYAAGGGEAFVYARSGDNTVGSSVEAPLERLSAANAFELELPAAYPSILRVAAASWGSAFPCAISVDGTALTLLALPATVANVFRTTDLAGDAGVDSTVAALSVSQRSTRAAHGYLFGLLACQMGEARAQGPEGQDYRITNSPLLPGVPIVIATETNGAWTYERNACADSFAPVLWTFELP